MLTEYLFVDAMPVAAIRPTGVSYIEADHLGTPRVSASPATNAKEWGWDLLGKAFGENAAATVVSGKDVSLRYPGQWMDAESGLNYNYFRDYDAATGRYLESDPIGIKGGVNTYAYVSGRPLGLSDPNGLEGIGPWTYPAGPMRNEYYWHKNYKECCDRTYMDCFTSCARFWLPLGVGGPAALRGVLGGVQTHLAATSATAAATAGTAGGYAGGVAGAAFFGFLIGCQIVCLESHCAYQ